MELKKRASTKFRCQGPGIISLCAESLIIFLDSILNKLTDLVVKEMVCAYICMSDRIKYKLIPRSREV